MSDFKLTDENKQTIIMALTFPMTRLLNKAEML